MSTLHVHIDESGDLDFSGRGSKFIIFAALWTYDPLPLASRLQSLRFTILKAGPENHRARGLERLEKFHCCDDSHNIRKLVVKTMLSYPGWKFAAVVVQKNKVSPRERELMGSFYANFASMPLRFLFRGPIMDRATRVLIYTDRFPSQCKQQLTEKAIKTSCRSEFPNGPPFLVFHHDSSSNAWLQAVDYCAHAVGRKWENAAVTPYYEMLKSRLASEEMNVLREVRTTYY